MNLDLTKPLQVRNLVTGRAYPVSAVRGKEGKDIFVQFGGDSAPGSVPLLCTFNSEDGSGVSPSSVLILENVPDLIDLKEKLQVRSVVSGAIYAVNEARYEPNGKIFAVFDGDIQPGIAFFNPDGSSCDAAKVLVLEVIPKAGSLKTGANIVWANIYLNPDPRRESFDAFEAYLYPSREVADRQRRPRCLACKQITFTVGEGLA